MDSNIQIQTLNDVNSFIQNCFAVPTITIVREPKGFFESEPKFNIYDDKNQMIGHVAKKTFYPPNSQQVIFQIGDPFNFMFSHPPVIITDADGDQLGKIEVKPGFFNYEFFLYTTDSSSPFSIAKANKRELKRGIAVEDPQSGLLALVDRHNYNAFFDPPSKYVCHFGTTDDKAINKNNTRDNNNNNININSHSEDNIPFMQITQGCRSRIPNIVTINTARGEQLLVHRELSALERLIVIAWRMYVDKLDDRLKKK